MTGKVDIPMILERKLDSSFPGVQFLIAGYSESKLLGGRYYVVRKKRCSFYCLQKMHLLKVFKFN